MLMATMCFYCSLFSMDGDFAPMVELAKLRKKHQFLLVIDDVSHFYIDAYEIRRSCLNFGACLVHMVLIFGLKLTLQCKV